MSDEEIHTVGRIEITVTCFYGLWKIFVKDHEETLGFALPNADEQEAKARGKILANMIRKEMDRVQGLT